MFISVTFLFVPVPVLTSGQSLPCNWFGHNHSWCKTLLSTRHKITTPIFLFSS
uniref:Uncharacterized protein n=1 Tax=Rhizophora mucronata TaxID=61149 RepID=A0A2P2P3D1_RHIMU